MAFRMAVVFNFLGTRVSEAGPTIAPKARDLSCRTADVHLTLR